MSQSTGQNCHGPLSLRRRDFLNFGLAGMATISWPDLMRLRAAEKSVPQREKTAVILVWLPGGLSHIDTFDPKPDIGSEYRGPFKPISTAVPGTIFTELLPRHAAIADKFTVLRSMYQYAAGHPAGSMQLLSGDPDTRDKPRPKFPDWMSVATYLRAREGGRSNPLPNYIGVNPPLEYNGPAYLGNAYFPFSVSGDPNLPNFSVPNVGLPNQAEASRLERRVALRQRLDLLERSFDRQRELGAIDEFESQAMSLLTSPEARDAFDLTKEDDATRDRYGRNRWGQQLLLARRLVEAGVEVVTSQLSGPLCGRVQNWDDHSVNHHIFDALRFRADAYDQACTALIEDLYSRGLDKRVLVCITGEFGRTPKIEYNRSTGAGDASGPTGTIQPGRDHWPRAFTNIWAGGGIPPGQLLGATDRRGEDVTELRVGPGDFLATIYRHLGIDSTHTAIDDLNGRPTFIVNDGSPVAELAPRVVT